MIAANPLLGVAMHAIGAISAALCYGNYLGDASMLFGHLLTNTAQVFTDMKSGRSVSPISP